MFNPKGLQDYCENCGCSLVQTFNDGFKHWAYGISVHNDKPYCINCGWYTKGYFGIEADRKDQVFEGFTQGYKWNGWATPSFTKEVAIEVLKHFDNFNANESETWRYDESKDAFIIYDEMCDEETDEIQGYDITVNGEVIHVYGIGSGSWVWDEYTQEEINELEG